MKKISILAILLAVSIYGYSQESPPFKFNVIKNLESTEVKSQDNTGTCWSFSASSFLESEILRKTKRKIDLSEMFVVRKIYLEKAESYLRYHGKANFSQGALAHDELHVMKTYGLMPDEAYPGKPKGSTHNHTQLEKSLKNYLDSLLMKEIIEPHWKEGFELILDNYLGVCPAVFSYENVSYTPITFAASLNINPSDYTGFTSFTHHPFYTSFSLEIPDNFSRGVYTNLPLNQMMEMIDNSIKLGYTVEWDGDVSEPGFARRGAAAILLNKGILLGDTIPVEIIPTQELRQAQFDSHETTDDHLMHITGMATDQKGNRYYITKNSWGKSYGINGYVYMSENYVKLKTVSIYVHNNAIPADVKKSLSKH